MRFSQLRPRTETKGKFVEASFFRGGHKQEIILRIPLFLRQIENLLTYTDPFCHVMTRRKIRSNEILVEKIVLFIFFFRISPVFSFCVLIFQTYFSQYYYLHSTKESNTVFVANFQIFFSVLNARFISNRI